MVSLKCLSLPIRSRIREFLPESYRCSLTMVYEWGIAWAEEGQFTRFHVSFDVPWMAFIAFGLVILIPVVLLAILSWKNLNKDGAADPEAKE